MTEVFREAFDSWGLGNSGLFGASIFGVKFRDIKDVNAYLLTAEERSLLVIIFACDDNGPVMHKLGNSGKDIFLVAGVTKILDEFVVDGEVWGKDKEVADPLLQVEVGDTGTHQPCFAYTGGDGKAE